MSIQEISTVVKLEAVHARQAGTTMYVGVARAEDLIAVTTIDRYNPGLTPTDKQQGYQRPAERSRITKIGRYLLEVGGKKIFPTAVILAARTPLMYDKRGGTVIVSSETPLQIVDGQHRIEGLRYAIREKGASEYESFPVPFVIIEPQDRVTEMEQFRTINGNAKSVRTDLVNLILTAVYADSSRSEVPDKDQWRVVVSKVVDKLARDEKSPWKGQISLPGDPPTPKGEPAKPARATSFITSLKPVYVWLSQTILDHQCRNLDEEADYMYKVVANFWLALRSVVPIPFGDPAGNVIQKTPGLFALHKLLRYLLHDMYRGRREFEVSDFKEFLADNPEITDPDFWSTTAGRASAFGSMKGFEELFQLISEPYKR